MNEVVKETAAEMADLRSRVMAFQQNRRSTECVSLLRLPFVVLCEAYFY